jgi:hypothetical protein
MHIRSFFRHLQRMQCAVHKQAKVLNKKIAWPPHYTTYTSATTPTAIRQPSVHTATSSTSTTSDSTTGTLAAAPTGLQLQTPTTQRLITCMHCCAAALLNGSCSWTCCGTCSCCVKESGTLRGAQQGLHHALGSCCGTCNTARAAKRPHKTGRQPHSEMNVNLQMFSCCVKDHARTTYQLPYSCHPAAAEPNNAAYVTRLHPLLRL